MEPRSARTSAPPAPPAPTAPPPGVRRRITSAASPPLADAPARSILSEATARRVHSDRDMRRKRPPAFSFLLRMATAMRLARVVSLLVLDFAGVALAIFTALMLKAV